MKKIAAYSTFLLVFLFGTSVLVNAQNTNIKNDIFWNTKDGKPIYSQGGGIFKFPDPVTGKNKYYWYGVSYKESALYRLDPSVTQPRSTFEAVTCYSSTDFVNWTAEPNVMTRSTFERIGKRIGWVGRLGVAYIKELNKYAMFVQFGQRVLIATADSPTAEFQWHQDISMEKIIGTSNTGDQTVFTDEDSGKSYLVYSYGRGRNKIYVSEIGVKDNMVNILDSKMIFQGQGREGNCMFKYKGKYYMAASNLYGWDASHVYYLMADDIRGPYTPLNNMQIMNGAAADYGHVTQTGFFYTIRGSKQETVLYCGDRWANFAGNGLGYNQWIPLSFDGATPYFNSLSSWNLDAHTGEWTVAKDNNYAKNGSFEADRKRIPSVVKPVQKHLTGWFSDLIKGNPIVVDTLLPSLNYFNTMSDRKIVIGEKSLQITDVIDFNRNVSQVISSSQYVKLEDGLYNLSARVRNTAGFGVLEMYAKSGGKTFFTSFKNEHGSWEMISLDKILVKNGQVEIGFIADGRANAVCHIDDVVFVLSNKF